MQTKPRESDSPRAAEPRDAAGPIRAALELATILALFAAAGAWPVPDVNETAYLTKARHFADPGWCRGDFFLETPDAHGVFYLLMGPLAAAVPLERAAWIGRWLGWIALAVGFRHAVGPLLQGSWPRIFAAAIFSLALRHTTAAGEWVIGGCEAKVFAWALVLVAVGEIGCGRFAWGWLAAGAATAVHPIVGGWSLLALVMTWAISAAAPFRFDAAVRRQPWLTWTLIVGGLLVAAVGVVPALGLSAGTDAATRAVAARIHVVERLSHHLLPRTFADGMLARHLLAIALWWVVVRLRPRAAADGTEAWRWSDRFILASLLIAIAGHGIALAEPFAPDAAYGLLRFYWFRLADVMVPFGLATALAAAVCDGALLRRLVPMRPAATRALLAVLLCVDLVHESRHWPLPGREGLVARSDTKVDAAAWRDICDWVAANTPADACFVTPRGAASFTWWTGRREVVGWKNSPQDARSLVEWRQRFVDCFSRDKSFANMERSTAALGADRLRRVADRYGATHAIIPLDVPGVDGLPFERLHANRGYAVDRLK